MFLSPWHTNLAIYFSWDYGRSLVLSDCQIFPVWFHCTMFRRLCCFRLTTVLENCHSDTLHNISRHKLATVFWNSIREISFMTRFKHQRCRCFTVRWELGYWTTCTNFKRHCTLPYCTFAYTLLGHNTIDLPNQHSPQQVGITCACSNNTCFKHKLTYHGRIQHTFIYSWAVAFSKPSKLRPEPC